jgi:hypothetical protein
MRFTYFCAVRGPASRDAPRFPSKSEYDFGRRKVEDYVAEKYPATGGHS